MSDLKPVRLEFRGSLLVAVLEEIKRRDESSEYIEDYTPASLLKELARERLIEIRERT